MKRIAVLFSLLFALLVPASAQLTMTGVGGGFGGAAGGCTTATFSTDGAIVTANTGAGTTVTTPGFSTTFCNNLVVVGILSSGGAVTSVTDAQSHLTFTKRAASGGGNNTEIWTAALSGAPLSGDAITVNAASGFITVLVNSFSGYKTSAPFDPNGALPSTQVGGTTCPWTTTNANDILYGFAANGTLTPDAGWALLSNATSAGNFLFGEWKSVSATQSGTTAPGITTNCAADAIQQGP